MPRPLDDKLLQEIKSLPDVEQVAGQINDVAAVVGKDGKIVSTGGAPTIAATYMPPPFAPIGFTKGRPPKGENEIALDAATADKEDFKLGDEVTVATSAPKRAFKLVGLATSASRPGSAGPPSSSSISPTAQTLFDKQGKVDFAFVAGRDGVSQTALSARSRPCSRRPRRCAPRSRRPTSSATTSAKGSPSSPPACSRSRSSPSWSARS